MKRDVQGKFALKHEDYRKVRCLRLTDATWKALGVAAECLGITRADYLEQIVRAHSLPSVTRKSEDNCRGNTQQSLANQPSITRLEQPPRQENTEVMERVAIALPQMADLVGLRERILVDLKLGKQAPGYKAAQKALHRFIAGLTSLS